MDSGRPSRGRFASGGGVIRIPVRGWAASSIEIHAEESWVDDAPEIEAVCAAFRRGNRRALAFDLADADLVLDGLTTLSNTEDERAEDLNAKRRDPGSTRCARLSSDGLSKLSIRLCAAVSAASAGPSPDARPTDG
jgi:hypothetical protein